MADQLTAADAFAAHAEAELHIDPQALVNPWAAAFASAAAFTLGAVLPLAAIVLPPAPLRVPVTMVAVLLALALLVIVNYFGWKYHGRFDWTASEIHTLSDKTHNILATLDQPVEIVVFLTPNQGNLELYEQVRNLVQLYEAASSQISVRFLDPVRKLAEAQQLAERFELSNPNVVVVASGDEKRILLESELAEMDFGGGFGAGRGGGVGVAP